MNKPEPFTELLTKRELEILALLVENKTNQEIADELHLALSSVKWYAGEIYGKLGVENRRQAVKKAAELGLLEKLGQEAKEAAVPFPSGIVTFLFTGIEGSTPLWEQMPEAMVEQSEGAELISRLLEALPEGFRQVLQLVDVEELDYPEVSEALLIPLGTVKSRLARARLKFRELAIQSGLLP